MTAKAITASSPRSLAPREHGAYGQLGVPLVAGLAIGQLNLAAACFAVAAVTAFVAHEPLLVVLGQRGTRARTQDGARATRRLLVLGPATLVLGGVGLFLATNTARMGAVLPILLTHLLGWFVWRAKEKTTIGEIVAATALSGAAFPVALAGGVDIVRAAYMWFVWTIAFAVTTFTVRAVIARAKRLGTALINVAYVATITAAVSTVGMALVGVLPAVVPIALAPFLVLAFAVLVLPVHTRHLRRVGWGLVSASMLTLVILVAMLK